jgi:hypothetical protein
MSFRGPTALDDSDVTSLRRLFARQSGVLSVIGILRQQCFGLLNRGPR